MNDAINMTYEAVDEQHADESAATRRQLVAGAGAALGGLGLLSLPGVSLADVRGQDVGDKKGNTPETILAVAATAEVLATIVNTVGGERNLFPDDPVTQANIEAAAREELIHYNVLVKQGGRPVTKRIWVPDAVFDTPEGLLSTLVVGDQIFINAYLIATQAFAIQGSHRLPRIAAEFMGAEAVHRALARQSLGLLGNDRVFMKFARREPAEGPGEGMRGFRDVTVAVEQLEEAGFGFGEQGATPGRFYSFDEVKRRTPNPPEVNTRKP